MANRLDSRSLTFFLAVAEALSFRQAAETLHMSQPPLSRAIRELEERLGARLFDRDSRGVALTAAGQRLLPRARRIIRLLEEAEDSVASTGEAPVLRLGLSNAVEPEWFAGLEERIRGERPGLSIVTVSDTSPRLVRMLRARRLDAAFIALPTETAGLSVEVLERLPMIVAMKVSHPLARRRVVHLIELNDERVFWFERARQPAFFDHCRRVFAGHGFAPKVVREPADHHVLLAEVAGGRALALLPRSFVALKRSGVTYRALKEGDELAVGVGLAMASDQLSFRALLVRCARVDIG